ncbi:hypothetical protein [Belnapia rosea]|uniref:hypothetical protein n=1 Tax=Belnapia rosea TaxID=938405 RepID=UPI00088F874B|nr:hypothetical protein [Belnapia rosea]SDB20990.1 hypothetical protein SAMN02927895_00830 [Belnapia rosea]
MPLRLLSLAAVAAVAAGSAPAQTAHSGAEAHRQHARQATAAPQAAGASLTVPGQDAFGAVQEIVSILLADPATDWAKVNLDGLRGHLVDMHEVTLRADAAVRRVEGGIEVAVTGQGRTLDAIRRMVPAHAREIDGRDGWQAGAGELPNGVTLTVTSADPLQATMIRGLGFIGVMAIGSHHQAHHLAMARGEFHGH